MTISDMEWECCFCKILLVSHFTDTKSSSVESVIVNVEVSCIGHSKYRILSSNHLFCIKYKGKDSWLWENECGHCSQ